MSHRDKAPNGLAEWAPLLRGVARLMREEKLPKVESLLENRDLTSYTLVDLLIPGEQGTLSTEVAQAAYSLLWDLRKCTADNLDLWAENFEHPENPLFQKEQNPAA